MDTRTMLKRIRCDCMACRLIKRDVARAILREVKRRGKLCETHMLVHDMQEELNGRPV